MRAAAIVFLVLASVAPRAVAGDGRLEINQRMVVAAGGFPFVIRQPGSYVLTGDLTLSAGSTTAIRVLEHDVTLDLNGFTIRGNHLCNQSGCPAGVGFGVEAGLVVPAGVIATRTTLLDGTVRGFGEDCVRLGPDARVEGLVATSCGASGIFVEERGLLLENRVAFCGTFGLRLINPTSYAHNIVSVADLGAGPGGAVSGGINGGGNVCDVGPCPGERRRFYLTTGNFPGDHQANVCTVGFHMASLWEILDPSSLTYDTELGHTRADSGEGPPSPSVNLEFLPTSATGWVRTGSLSDAVSGQPGQTNCSAWSTASSGAEGSTAALRPEWTDSPIRISPWVTESRTCNSSIRAWCVQD